MSKRISKADYWQDAPMPRHQMVLIPTALEDVIPPNHPVRLLDEILDQVDWSPWESQYTDRMGQPPIHPSILAKVLLWGMIRLTRSSRQLEYHLKHSIDFMWLASGRTIDHTTLCNFRRKNKGALSDLFKQMVRLAIDLKLANVAELCIDGTRVLGNASRSQTWTEERLKIALNVLDSQITAALAALELNDQVEDLYGTDVTFDQLPKDLAEQKARRDKLAEVLDKVQAMDAERKADAPPAQIPKADTDSRILPNKEGGYAPNFTPMVTTESQSGFIVDVDVVIGNVEHTQLTSTVQRVETEFETKVEAVLADAAYITGENLDAAQELKIDLVGPLPETSKKNPALREDPTQPVAEQEIGDLPTNPQTKRFSKLAFVYDAQTDLYYCPQGKPLQPVGTGNRERNGKKVIERTFRCAECAGCPLASFCRKDPQATGGREITADNYEPARRAHREKMNSPESQKAYSRRQHFGEIPFAIIKSLFGVRRFLLRGIDGVQQEWRWAATAYNLKKLIKHMGNVRTELAAAAQMATV
jgi:transposase